MKGIFMDVQQATLSQGNILGEHIAQQVFGMLPDDGPFLMIYDRDGNGWPSDTEKFSKLNMSDELLKDLCDRIDDGVEPVIIHWGDSSLAAAGLATEYGNSGYVIIVWPRTSCESTPINTDLAGILLEQIGLIARLAVKNQYVFP